MFRSGLLALVLMSSLLLEGCAFWRPDKIHYTWRDQAEAPCSDCTPTPGDTLLVGLAISGGGARASVFGAAAIEALMEEGVMDRVTHISSVSGGGFPAAYYALHKPRPCDTSTPEGDASCVSTFKDTMRRNFLTDLTLRQIVSPGRFSSPTRRLLSLRDALDDEFIGEAAFADLPPSPVLLINGARYDDARRFVFSNLAIPEAASNIPPFTEETLRTASFSLPGCPRSTPPDFSVALAIAISAGFPPLLGPASIEAQETCNGENTRYWHLGDGGILENTGVETLEDYALHAEFSGERPKQVIIFSMDAGRSTSSDIMMQTRNLKLWTSDPGRVVDIVGKRASAYRSVALENYYTQSGVDFHILKMRYTDARLSQWPSSCGERQNDPSAISAHLATIPTNFKITDCDADLMEMAAHDLVRRTLTANKSMLEQAGLSYRD
ncbi:patatin-like phospholipase family protein [Hyphococcus flavus]|uniref:Patatin-like phospholipase family protein n=1 Tax=Hyphococcus flavus TaxID=1866326 RepID=A0AAF0CIQ9_9PROT|nr:patatin-like phospholipase family protein [Hyphococcus flavus]WDI33117.1 patatin-like phospholipase family protein [Hyphococcus flavus]